jgi:hypothetical protein
MSKQIETVRSRPALWALAGAGILALVLVASVAALSASGLAAPAATAQYAPTNTAAPTIAGTAQEGNTLTANPGAWTGDQPIVFTYQWLRCNAGGNNCTAIPSAVNQTYQVQGADVSNTLRVQVTGRNSQGASTATSAQTAVVTRQAAPAPGASRNVSAVSPPDRLIVDRVEFRPNPVRSRTQPITVRVRVLDTDGFAVQDALVFIRSTPVVTSTPPEGRTGADGWVTFQTLPQADFPLRNGYSVQFFVRARKQGDNPLAGVSGRRLVQVGTAR